MIMQAKINLIEIGKKNVAPSKDDLHHDVYVFFVDLSSSEKPFWFEQSIGGGLADRGGAIALSLQQLESWSGDWRSHLQNAGCEWVIPLLQAELLAPVSCDSIVSRIIDEATRRRSMK
jgi:hypothetical protein